MTGLARRRLAWLAVLAALSTAGFTIVRASSAALSPPRSSVWAHGEVVLADEPVSAGLFDVERMLPGQAEVRCIVVRYEGTPLPAEVRLYATGVSGGLAPFLDVLVETGAGCDPFVAGTVAFAGTLDGMPPTWSEAGAGWPARPGARRAYRFSVTLRPDPGAEGLDATAGLTWDAREGRPGRTGAGTAAGPRDLQRASDR